MIGLVMFLIVDRGLLIDLKTFNFTIFKTIQKQLISLSVS